MLGLPTYSSGPYPFTGIRVHSKCKASFVGHQQQVGVSALIPIFLHENACVAAIIIIMDYMTQAAPTELCRHLLAQQLFREATVRLLVQQLFREVTVQSCSSCMRYVLTLV